MGLFVTYSINTIATRFIILPISIFTTILSARILEPAGVGQLTLIFLIPTFAVAFGGLGIGHAVNYYATRTAPTKLLVNSFILSMITGILLFLLTLPIVAALKNIFFRPVSEEYIILISFFIPFFLFNAHLMSLLQAFYKFNLRNLLLISQAILNGVLLALLLAVLDWGVMGAVTSGLTSLLFAVIVSTVFLFKEIKVNEIGLDFSLMKQLFTFGLKSHVGNVLKELTYRGDLLLISYFLPAALVGQYAIAVYIAEAIWMIPDSIGTVLLPQIAMLDKKEGNNFTPSVCRRTIIPLLLISLTIYAVGGEIITFVLGDAYQPSVFALYLLIPGVLAFSIWKLLANDLIGRGYPALYSMTSGLGLLTMITLDLILIPAVGINGAAIAASLSYMAASVAIILIYVRITHNSIGSLLVPHRSDFVFLKNQVLKFSPLQF